MHSDSFSSTNASTIIPMSSCNPKDFAKKKRGNRAAKLKQCKLDARREQWLSQVKKKGDKEESCAGRSGSCVVQPSHRRDTSIEKLDIMSRGDKESDDGSMHHYSDSESPSNSPISHISSDLGGNDSVSNFTGSSRSSSSSSSGGCCSESISGEDEEEDDECVDDWEAVADALAATDEKQEDQHCVLHSAPENKNAISVECHPEEANGPVSVIDVSKSEAENGTSVQRALLVSGRAWRPDDAFRPQSLPTLSKQYSFPLNPERHYSCGGPTWGRKNVSAPTSCPICFEDLDLTDSSFLPCSCGFGLCLFCYKRILEDDGRCPGCRKQYDRDVAEREAASDGNSLTFRLARSCSLITRS